MIDYFTKNHITNKNKGNGFSFEPNDGDCISKCVTTKEGTRMENNYIKIQDQWQQMTDKRTEEQYLLNGYKIRRLTPLECWRLQNFPDEQFFKAQQVNSDTQLYKQAGNSITVIVIQKIIQSIFKN